MAEQKEDTPPVESEDVKKLTQFKVEVKPVKKWWKSEEEGQENEKDIVATCAISFLGVHQVESEAITFSNESDDFRFNFAPTFDINEDEEEQLIHNILNAGMTISLADSNKEPICSFEIDLEALVQPNITDYSETIRANVLEAQENLQGTVELSFEVSTSKPLVVEEGGLIGRCKSLCLAPVPESLVAAVEATSICPTFVGAVEIPGVSQDIGLHFEEGSLKGSQMEWAASQKFYVPPSDIPEFKQKVKKGKCKVEVARRVPSEMKDPFQKEYTFHSSFNMSTLLAPGILNFHAECLPDVENEVESIELELIEAKEYEEKVPKYAEELEIEENHNVWKKVDAKLSLDVVLDSPLLKPWSLPEDAGKKLSEYIPTLEERKTTESKKKVLRESFIDKCKTIGKLLVRDYGEMLDEDSSDDMQSKIVYSLNKSGAYLKMKEFLKNGAIAVIEEQLESNPRLKEMEKHALLNEAYCTLLAYVKDALKDMQHVSQEKPVDDNKIFYKMKMLADEYEMNGDKEIAEKYYMDRLYNSKQFLPGLFHEYGTFCLRAKMIDKAEECLREELSRFPDAKDSLFALAAILIQQSMGPKGNKYSLEHAETLLQSALNNDESNNVMWALLCILYKQMKGVNSQEYENCLYKACQEKKMIQLGLQSIEADGMMHLVFQMLDISLPHLALEALEVCEGIPHIDRLICESQIHFLLENFTKASQVLEEAKAECDAADIRPYVIEGKSYFQMKSYSEAVHSFNQVMSINADAMTLDVLLMFGTCLLKLESTNSTRAALDVFTFASQKCPCASTWLGCAIACLNLEDYENAEVALAEACILDSKNLKVWGYTCILALKLGRAEEAERALDIILLENLTDVQLLDRIASDFSSNSMHGQAEQVYRKRISIEDNVVAKNSLANTLMVLGKNLDAKKFFENVLSSGISPEEQNIIQEKVANIVKQYGLAQ